MSLGHFHLHHSDEDLESALYLPLPTPPLYQFRDHDDATDDSLPGHVNPPIKSSPTRSNRASSTIFPLDNEDQEPCQDLQRATFRASLATSEFLWLCGPALKRLTEINSLDETEQTSDCSPPINKISIVPRRKRSFLSRNISQSQGYSQNKEEQKEKQHPVYFEITRPDPIYESRKQTTIPQPTPSPSDYWDLCSSVSSDNEKNCGSVDPFSIAEGIVEYQDLPTPAVAHRRMSLKKDCFFFTIGSSKIKHCRMISSPTLSKFDRAKDQRAATLKKAYILAFIAFLSLIALTCLILGCRIKEKNEH